MTFYAREARGIALAGGMESMTNAALFAGPGQIRLIAWDMGNFLDHMFLDGLEDAYGEPFADGRFRGRLCRAFQFTRHRQDAIRRHLVGAGANGRSPAGSFEQRSRRSP